MYDPYFYSKTERLTFIESKLGKFDFPCLLNHDEIVELIQLHRNGTTEDLVILFTRNLLIKRLLSYQNRQDKYQKKLKLAGV